VRGGSGGRGEEEVRRGDVDDEGEGLHAYLLHLPRRPQPRAVIADGSDLMAAVSSRRWRQPCAAIADRTKGMRRLASSRRHPGAAVAGRTTLRPRAPPPVREQRARGRKERERRKRERVLTWSP